MMNKLLPALAVAALCVVAYAPAHAADAPADSTVATLQVKQGTVMQSTGGEFVNADTGARLLDGERIMVTENTKAVVVFDDKCRNEYTNPGVYAIDRGFCRTGYIANENMSASVAAAAVLAPLLIDNGSVNPPPISK